MTKEYWASYNHDEFTEGPYLSIEEAKADIIEQHMSEIADGTYEVLNTTSFRIGSKVDIREFARRYLKSDAESIIENLDCSLYDQWYGDDPVIGDSEHNINLMTKLLEKFFDECEFETCSFLIEDIQEFKFDEVAND